MDVHKRLPCRGHDILLHAVLKHSPKEVQTNDVIKLGYLDGVFLLRQTLILLVDVEEVLLDALEQLHTQRRHQIYITKNGLKDLLYLGILDQGVLGHHTT